MALRNGERPTQIARPDRTITVFGSSRAAEDSQDYREALELGRLLASHGFTVCNGGYLGSMAAVSRGAREAGGRVVGVTLENIAWEGPNRWLSEEVRAGTIFLRLEKLISVADAFVVLRGASGTLNEFATVWMMLAYGILEPRPFVVMGRGWHRILEALSAEMPLTPEDLRLITVVDGPAEALEAVRKALG